MASIVRFPRFEVYGISLIDSPKKPLKGLIVLQCQILHSRVHYSALPDIQESVGHLGAEFSLFWESPHEQCFQEESIGVILRIQVSM